MCVITHLCAESTSTVQGRSRSCHPVSDLHISGPAKVYSFGRRLRPVNQWRIQLASGNTNLFLQITCSRPFCRQSWTYTAPNLMAEWNHSHSKPGCHQVTQVSVSKILVRDFSECGTQPFGGTCCRTGERRWQWEIVVSHRIETLLRVTGLGIRIEFIPLNRGMW